MTRRNRTLEENERRAKIRELLQTANIGSMKEIFRSSSKRLSQSLWRTLLRLSLTVSLAIPNMTTRINVLTTAAADTAKKLFAPAPATSSSPYPEIGRAGSSLSSLRRTRIMYFAGTLWYVPALFLREIGRQEIIT